MQWKRSATHERLGLQALSPCLRHRKELDNIGGNTIDGQNAATNRTTTGLSRDAWYRVQVDAVSRGDALRAGIRVMTADDTLFGSLPGRTSVATQGQDKITSYNGFESNSSTLDSTLNEQSDDYDRLLTQRCKRHRAVHEWTHSTRYHHMVKIALLTA